MRPNGAVCSLYPLRDGKVLKTVSKYGSGGNAAGREGESANRAIDS